MLFIAINGLCGFCTLIKWKIYCLVSHFIGRGRDHYTPSLGHLADIITEVLSNERVHIILMHIFAWFSFTS
jgi:hypothetical protein